MENGDTSSSESEQMRYGMLGGDLLNTGEKLEKYTGAVGWSDLLPHFKSKALLYVDPTLAIADVGAALATDDKAKVERWIASGDLVRPGEAHAELGRYYRNRNPELAKRHYKQALDKLEPGKLRDKIEAALKKAEEEWEESKQ